MATIAKCAHPACQCMVPPNEPQGKHCRDHYKQAKPDSEFTRLQVRRL